MKNLICIISIIFFYIPYVTGNVHNSSNDMEGNGKKVKMILDADVGIDDAMALAYALGSPDIELIGVTAIYGNASTETGVRNTLDLLSLLNREDIPVYAGALHSYSSETVFHPNKGSRRIHGDNGVGDVQLPISNKTVEKQNAADFIVESARKYGKELVIVAVGPMTNLADAIKKEPDLKNMVGNIVIMGGALTVPGNVSMLAEANIHQDPVAANYLFTSGTPITMVGLDVTLRALLPKEDTKKWRDLGTASGIAFADIVDFYIEAYRPLPGCALHDPLAVAVAVQPDLVQTIPLFMVVGTKEDWGRTIGDKTKLLEPNPNMKVAVNVDHKKFVADFNKVLIELFKKN